MRKAIFVFFIMLGAAVGLFASLNGDLGLKIVMTGTGALFGTAIGGGSQVVGCVDRRHVVEDRVERRPQLDPDQDRCIADRKSTRLNSSHG